MHILLVEDHRLLRDQLTRGLHEEGHLVDAVGDGASALSYAESRIYHALILDVMLPGHDGFTVCRHLRAAGNRTPILMLSARQQLEDRVQGLDAGADDYLTKPFAFVELLARLRALDRRPPDLRIGPLRAGDVTLDPLTHRVERAGRQIYLTPREFAILELLLRHPQQVLSRDQIAAGAWEREADHASNVVDVFMRTLRRKLDDPWPYTLLQTVRGAGYMLCVPKCEAAR